MNVSTLQKRREVVNLYLAVNQKVLYGYVKNKVYKVISFDEDKDEDEGYIWIAYRAELQDIETKERHIVTWSLHDETQGKCPIMTLEQVEHKFVQIMKEKLKLEDQVRELDRQSNQYDEWIKLIRECDNNGN